MNHPSFNYLIRKLKLPIASFGNTFTGIGGLLDQFRLIREMIMNA